MFVDNILFLTRLDGSKRTSATQTQLDRYMYIKHLIGCMLIATGSSIFVPYRTSLVIVFFGFVVAVVGYLFAQSAFAEALYRKGNFLEAELPNGWYHVET